ncbi:MAG TPA: glucosyl-3-phosphoglycerate synthase [Candidatus Limnocylindrales bacterium]|nr:glucosyl-3-phosphoglycerate synthase [Candidatus Limnocylindrales bacterium]
MAASSVAPQRIIIPVVNPRTAKDLVRIGLGLLGEGGSLVAASIVEIADGTPLSEGAVRARQARRLLQGILEFVPDGSDTRTTVRIGRRASESIVELASEEQADLVLFGWRGPSRERRDSSSAVFSPTIDEVVRSAQCNIAVVKQRGLGVPGRVVVPVRGGPHAALALRFADLIGKAYEARVDVINVVPFNLSPPVRAQAQEALAAFVRARASERSRPKLVEGADVVEVILREAAEADLVVLGATATYDVDASAGTIFGLLPERIAQQAHSTVMVVKTSVAPTRDEFDARAREAGTLEAAEIAVKSRTSVAARVDRWFAESSFHHVEFADLRRLVSLKERRGVTISAVLPTLNEAATIGPIVRAARRELMEAVPLVDELLVIDSDSSDDTVAIAETEGARVVRHPQVLPSLGSYRGKGEALWKSLHETHGDLIAWSDTDIRDWHPRFLYGPLGPLLAEPRIGYVKAFYQRPIVEGGVLKEGAGGRVTELVARPLINLFYPELSGYVQPLSGEYAGRRSHLESIPFFTGYAVEIGHLIDLCARLGLEGLGQVDLDVRVHRNQDLEGLSKMSFVILQAAMKRLEQRHGSSLFADLGLTMKLPRSSPGRLSLEVIDLIDAERPPMVTIPDYLAAHPRRAS